MRAETAGHQNKNGWRPPHLAGLPERPAGHRGEPRDGAERQPALQKEPLKERRRLSRAAEQRQCRKSIQERAERCKRQQTETQHKYSTIDTRQVYTRDDIEANAYRERSYRPAMARCSPGRRILLQIPVRVRQRRRALQVVAVPLQAPPGKGAS